MHSKSRGYDEIFCTTKLPKYICALVVLSFVVQLPSFHHSSARCRYNSPDPQIRASKERISGVVP